MKIVIDRFEGPFRFLANDYPAEVEYEGHVYPSVEHAYQAARTQDPAQRAVIRQAPSAHIARQMGSLIQPEPASLAVLEDLVCQKFTRHPDLRKKLAQTRGMVLTGELGRILMRVRDEPFCGGGVHV